MFKTMVALSILDEAISYLSLSQRPEFMSIIAEFFSPTHESRGHIAWVICAQALHHQPLAPMGTLATYDRVTKRIDHPP